MVKVEPNNDDDANNNEGLLDHVFRYMPETSVHKATHILEVNKRHDATTATEEGLGREREAS